MTIRSIIATCAMGALALSADTVALAETVALAQPTAPQQTGEAQVAASFARYSALPAASATPHAVDIDSFDPPVEAEAEAAGTAIAGGTASFYGAKFHGRRTASGQAFDMNAMTAAHRTLPFGSKVRVTNPANGHSVTVTINDRGPFHGNRVIDVSRAAASELGLIQRGSGKVELALLD